MYLANRLFRATFPFLLGVVVAGLPLFASPRRAAGDKLLTSMLIPNDFYSATFTNPAGAYLIPSSIPKAADAPLSATESKLWYDLTNTLGLAPANTGPAAETDSEVKLEGISELSVTAVPKHSAFLLLGTGLALIWAGKRLG